MKISRAVLVAAVIGLTGSAFATTVEWTLTPSSISNTAPADTTVRMYVKDWPAGKDIDGASVYLQYDKTKFSITDAQWNTTILDTAFTTEYADGTVLSALKTPGGGSGNPTNTTVMLTFKIHPKVSSLAPGTYSFGPKTPDGNTVLTANPAQPVDTTWQALRLTVTKEANPARDVTAAAASPQKDPVRVVLSWTQGSADDFQMQWKRPSETTWKAVTTGLVKDVANKRIDWTTQGISGFAKYETVQIRVRALDGGKVWDASQNKAVDAAAYPNVGWAQVPNDVVVDNDPPKISSATATTGDTKVYVTYSEDMADNAKNAANYTVRRTDNQQVVNVTGADFQSGNRKVVILTLAQALSQGVVYRLTPAVNQITDRAGNALTTNQWDITLVSKPKLTGASLKQDGVNKTVVAEFNVPMKSVGTVSQWTLQVVGGAAVQISSVTLDQTDKRKVNVVVGAALAQGTKYRLTCASDATSEANQQVGTTDNTAEFTTPFWQVFAVEATKVYSVGIPLNVPGGRVRTLLGASAVAAYDPTQQSPWIIDNGGNTQVPQVVGKGYFARWARTGNITAYVSGSKVSAPQQLSVPAGWNLVTNPFFSNLPLSQLKLGTKAFRYAWWWDGNSYKLVANVAYPPIGAESYLRPWVGYWVRCTVAGNISFSAAPSAAGEAVEPFAVGAEGDVLIPLVARAGDVADTVAVCGIGQKPEAVANPPFVSGSVDLAFVGGAEPLAIDVRTGSPAQKWELVCKTDLANVQVTISAPDLSRVPSDYAVILTDVETGRKAYLRTSAGYTFTAGPEGAERRLVLELVPRSASALVASVAVAQTGAGRVAATYTLSAPAAVTAEVMNIAGRVVKRLVADKPETAGTHTLSWDLTNAAGSVVPRGTYLLSVTARTEDGQQVKAVRAFTVSR